MMYATGHETENGQVAIRQRTPEGWGYIKHMCRSAAVQFCNDANERLRQTYADNGIEVAYPRQF
jgi:hypothetical protein